MARPSHRSLRFLAVAALLGLYPLVPLIDYGAEWLLGAPVQLERHIMSVLVFALLTQALCLQVGQAGIMQLGIAAFFALGAFGAGILCVEKYPMQLGFWGALLVVPALCGLIGALVSGPCAGLRGDYLAMVTLAFAELVRVTLLNLEGITDGSRGLNPLPVPQLPAFLIDSIAGPARQHAEFLAIYYTAVASVLGVHWAMGTLLSAPLGRSLCAMRENTLACASLGISPNRLRLIAFVAGATISGLAGVLYATYLTTTAEPNNYDFNLSTMVLCAAILGGISSPRGVLLGAALLITFDNLLAPAIAHVLVRVAVEPGGDPGLWGSFSSWRLLIFGVALIGLMRLRPMGLWPSQTAQHGERWR